MNNLLTYFKNFIKSIFMTKSTLPHVQPQPIVKTPVQDTVQAPVQATIVQPITPAVLRGILVRNGYGQKETTGTLNIILPDGTFWTCKTLELPWIDNHNNISCIPVGTYPCVLSPFHNVERYRLSNTGVRTDVFMHDGNYATGNKIDTEGCILLGSELEDINGDGSLDVIDSVNTNLALLKITGGKPFTLQIK